MQTLPGPEARHLAGLLAAMDRPWQALFDANQRLVMSQALKLSGRRTDLDDLLQEGRLGLLRAIELFDPRLGFRFSTYACKPIREFIQNTLDEQHRPIRPGSGRIRVERKLHHAERELEGTLLRQPKEEELAARMGWTLAELMSHRACTPRVSSLDLLDESGKQRRDLEPKDPHTPLEAALSQLMAGAVRASLPALPQRERKVILLRYGLGPSGAEMTHKAIGALLGVSGARVQQLENQALKRLRARIEPTSGRQIA
jgi:RNA polymerase primary sigma factor